MAIAALTAALAVVLLAVGVLELREQANPLYEGEDREWQPGASAPFVVRLLSAITHRVETRSGTVRDMVRSTTARGAKLDRVLVQAGRPWGGITGTQLDVMSLVGGLVVTVGAVYICLLLGVGWVIGVLIGLLVGLLPRMRVKSMARQRVREIKGAIPGMLDLLVLSAEAGGTPRAGLRLVAEKMTGALADEVAYVERNLALGKDEETALLDLAERTGVPELEEMANNIVTATRFGALQYHAALEAQAERVRLAQRQETQRLIHSMTIKMIFPIAMFFLPSMMLVLLGPSLVQFTRLG